MRALCVPVPVGSLWSQSASRFAAFVRTAAQFAWPSPVSGASQALPLLLRWLALTTTRPPVAFSSNAWAIAGRLRGAPSPPLTKATEFSAAVVPIGVTLAGL